MSHWTSYGELVVHQGESEGVFQAPGEAVFAVNTIAKTLLAANAPYLFVNWVSAQREHSLFIPAGSVVQVSYERQGFDAPRARELAKAAQGSAAYLHQVSFDEDWNVIPYTPGEEEGSAE